MIIPVAKADAMVAKWRRHSSLRCPRRIGAHISLIVPFLSPGLIDREVWEQLSRIAADHRPFDFELVRVRRFPPAEPGGRQVLYLAPAPERPFIELVEALWERWPETPPYGGEFARVIPHLTVTCASPAVLDQAETELQPKLPLRAQARELWLTQMVSDEHARIDRFRLGQASGVYGVRPL